MSKSKAEKERDEFELQSIAMESSNDDIESPSNERIGLLPHQMPSSSGTDDPRTCISNALEMIVFSHV